MASGHSHLWSVQVNMPPPDVSLTPLICVVRKTSKLDINDQRCVFRQDKLSYFHTVQARLILFTKISYFWTMQSRSILSSTVKNKSQDSGLNTCVLENFPILSDQIKDIRSEIQHENIIFSPINIIFFRHFSKYHNFT